MDCPEDIIKKVLARVHDLIIPSLLNPLMLAGAGQRLLRWGGGWGRRGTAGVGSHIWECAGRQGPHSACCTATCCLLRQSSPTCAPPPPSSADFLTATLDRGGLLGMLALNGIFLLVTRHGLEYPRFYQRLYQLLTPDAFHVGGPVALSAVQLTPA